MPRFFLYCLLICSLAGSAWSVDPKLDPDRPVPDSNAAYYEGESYRYIVPAPRSFRMVEAEAQADGYSFAFIPKAERYDSASVVIGINIYKIRGLKFEEVFAGDTTGLRKHYGPKAEIREVDSVSAEGGKPIRTLYINSPNQFLPNVMMAYLNGGSEIVIYELLISPNALRPRAEEIFVACLRNTRVLKIGTLGSR